MNIIKNRIKCYVCDTSKINECFLDNHINDIPPQFVTKIGQTIETNKKIQTFSIGYLISKYFNSEDIKKINYDKNGKIILSDNSINISCSHNKNLVVVAFCKSAIGVDVEKIENIDFSQIIKNHFNINEMNYINLIKNNRKRLIMFLKFWSMKEALYKSLINQSNVKYLNLEIKKSITGYYSVVEKSKFYFSNYILNGYLLSISKTKRNQFIQIEIISI